MIVEIQLNRGLDQHTQRKWLPQCHCIFITGANFCLFQADFRFVCLKKNMSSIGEG